MRGFRDIAADADDLGRAAAQATRAARKTYANVPSPSPEFDRLEPSMENRGADPDAPYSYDESVEEAERYAPPPQAPAARTRVGQDREPKKRVRSGAGALAPWLMTAGRTSPRRSGAAYRNPAPFGAHNHL